ncbi:MAG TPA: coenzyme F420-0:L-glutamate ligase [Candidatus Nitrosotalea sp.]|nr:coenzyme F420-0:L-glutamate ligase [Candidatus Nitrosotalea sp.]
MIVEIIPIQLEKEVKQNDDLVDLILSAGHELRDRDILVITQKIISKQEGQIVDLSDVNPSLLAMGIASEYGKDPRLVQLILDQSKRVVRMRNGIIISETIHGYVCANAGVDESNVGEGKATLLPRNPDETAERLRRKISEVTGKEVGVVISDTFGRPFREGQTNVAIGVAGIGAIRDYAGMKDNFGRILRVTAIAAADELCSAAELVMGKFNRTPISIIRNYRHDSGASKIRDIIRPKSNDLFR